MKRHHLLIGLAGLWLLLPALLVAQGPVGFRIPDELPSATGPIRVKKILEQYPQQPGLQPAFTIPLGPLGFSVPGNSYLLRKESLVSLDFLDEDRLLFTFHIASGLLERDADNGDTSPQQIQAEVLSLPSGHIESKAKWSVPDRMRYLWMLNDGHFLLRVPEGLDEGDAELKTKPGLRLPGRLLWISMDPKQEVLMANSLESGTVTPGAGDPGGPGPEAQSAAAEADGQKPGDAGVLVIRTIKRATGDEMHVSRAAWTHQTDDWPTNSEGYVERLQDKQKHWVLKFNAYSGKSWLLAGVDSTCRQKYSFLSDTELLATVCDPAGGWNLQGVSMEGHVLWKQKLAWNTMLPLLVVSRNGLRAARETLVLKRTIDHYKGRLVGVGDFLGQMVRVFDTSNGKTILEAPLTPIFDGGGNVAISPSGQRVAILSGGVIQVFELPAPTPPPVHERLPKPTAAGAPPTR